MKKINYLNVTITPFLLAGSYYKLKVKTEVDTGIVVKNYNFTHTMNVDMFEDFFSRIMDRAKHEIKKCIKEDEAIKLSTSAELEAIAKQFEDFLKSIGRRLKNEKE